MRRLPRLIPALVLIAVYSLIVIGPLAPLALHVPVIAHAVTGECASGCSNCGCSPERKANHTCCCQKKQRYHHHSAPGELGCCKKGNRTKSSTPPGISSCPCGGNRVAELLGFGQDELLPFHFGSDTPVFSEASLGGHISPCRPDWLGEPPEPPPKPAHTT